MRVMGLDVGERRIGVAVNDPLGITAQGVGVIERSDAEGDVNEIRRLVEEYAVESLVVGVPLNMDGSVGKSASEILKFAEALRAALKIPVATYDERLSTKESEKLLISHDVSRRKRKKTLDVMAAQLILQSYLSRLSHSRGDKADV